MQTSISYPRGFTTTSAYDATGESTSKQFPNGDVVSYAYDAIGRQVSIVYDAYSRVTFAYDAVGNRTTMMDPGGTTTYAYDGRNLQTGKTDPGSFSQGYAYDAVGQRTKFTEPDGKARTFTYDADGRTTIFQDQAGLLTTFQYDAAGRETTTLYGSGLRQLASFDGNGQQTLGQLDFGTVPTLQNQTLYSYDAVGNRFIVQDSSAGTFTYSYDAKSRLTRSQGSLLVAHDFTYTYDALDNRLSDTETGALRSWSYDASSRLTTMVSGGVTTFYSYDVNGNLNGVAPSGVTTTTMTHDHVNRLVQYWDGTTLTVYTYDGDGMKRTEGSTTLVWDGTDYAGAVHGGIFDTKTYTVDGRILAERAADRTDYGHDALGSVTDTFDQTHQSKLGVMRYKPYGDALINAGTTPIWQWVGSHGYRTTGLGYASHYVRARHYSDVEGQWTTVDLLWPTESAYTYVSGNPTMGTDSSGLQGLKPILTNLNPRKPTSDCSHSTWSDFANSIIPGWDKAISSAIAGNSCCQSLISSGMPIYGRSYGDAASDLEALRSNWLFNAIWCISCQETQFSKTNCYGPHDDVSTSATGPMGMLDETWSRFGTGDENNPYDNLAAGVALLCWSLCIRTQLCSCNKAGRTGSQSPRPRRPQHSTWPSNRWPYMPGGTDPDSTKTEFANCMSSGGSTGPFPVNLPKPRRETR